MPLASKYTLLSLDYSEETKYLMTEIRPNNGYFPAKEHHKTAFFINVK